MNAKKKKALKKFACFSGRQIYDLSRFSARQIGNVLLKYSRPEEVSGIEKVVKSFSKRISYKYDSQYNPNIYDLTRYFYSQGIVGEESVCLLSTIALVYGDSVLIRGSSGSGKTRIQETLFALVPEGLSYRLGYTTLSALMNNADKINKASVLFVPELQKVLYDKDLQEAFKDISNGDAFVKEKADSNGNVKKLVIRGDLSLNTSIADQNTFTRFFNSQTESYRRFVHLYTRIDGNITRSVIESKAIEDAYPLSLDENFSQAESKRLGKQVAASITNKNIRFINPFAEYIIKDLPDQDEMISSFIDHYRDMIKGYAKYHFQNRAKAANQKDVFLFCNLEDIKRVHDLYSIHFSRSMKEISKKDTSMRDCIDMFFENIDWQECFDFGVNVMKSQYNPSFEDWLNTQLHDCYVISTNPFNGDLEAIAEYNHGLSSYNIA